MLDHLGQLDPPPAHGLMDLAKARSGRHRPLRELLHRLGVLPGGQLGGIGDEGEDLVGRPRDLNRGARQAAATMVSSPCCGVDQLPIPRSVYRLAALPSSTPASADVPSGGFAGIRHMRWTVAVEVI